MTHGGGVSAYSRFPTICGRYWMKKLIVWLVCILLFSLNQLAALDLGISLGTFDASNKHNLVDEGSHVQLGIVMGIAPRWDVETFIIAQATPCPLGDVLGGAAISFALMGPVYEHPSVKEIPSYGNAYMSLGFMGNPVDSDTYGPFFRIVPITVGGPQFRLRERGASVGIFYNIAGDSVTIFWNIFLLDFYL